MERIANQLKEYCDCVEFDDKDVNELVSIVSMLTCWAYEDCDTFLMGDRREVIDLPSCEECVRLFKPYFHPFVPESFKFSLIKISGTTETRTEITDFAYSELEEAFRVNTGLPSCKCIGNPCGCPPEYKLLVEYIAGYDSIPDCDLPVFCNLLEVIHDKNKCECCNTDCGCETKDEIRYACGDVVSVQVETDFGKMIAELAKEMIGRMSLCEDEPTIWGVIV